MPRTASPSMTMKPTAMKLGLPRAGSVTSREDGSTRKGEGIAA